MRSEEVQQQYVSLSGFEDATVGDWRNLSKLCTGEAPNPDLAHWAIGRYKI